MSASKTISWQNRSDPHRQTDHQSGDCQISRQDLFDRSRPSNGHNCGNRPGSAANSKTGSVESINSGQTNRPESVFLKASPAQSSVYKGEELVVSFDLYYQNNIRQYGRKKMPDAQGFWIEEFPMPAQPRISNTTVNGVAYRKATIQQIA
jgi:hypothetical protein